MENSKEDKLEEIQELEFWRTKYLSKRNTVVVGSVLGLILVVDVTIVLFRLVK